MERMSDDGDGEVTSDEANHYDYMTKIKTEKSHRRKHKYVRYPLINITHNLNFHQNYVFFSFSHRIQKWISILALHHKCASVISIIEKW